MDTNLSIGLGVFALACLGVIIGLTSGKSGKAVESKAVPATPRKLVVGGPYTKLVIYIYCVISIIFQV